MNHLLALGFGLLCSLNLALASSEPTTPPVFIKVNLTEMKMQIEGAQPDAPLVLKTGVKYKIAFENLGVMEHEVLLGRGLIKVGDENDYSEHLLSNTEVTLTGAKEVNGQKRIWAVDTKGIHEIELEAGLRLSIIFKLPESARGEWELGCFMPGHHEAGMKLPLKVQ